MSEVHEHKATNTILKNDPDFFKKINSKRKNIPGGSFRDKNKAREAALKRWAKYNIEKENKSESQAK